MAFLKAHHYLVFMAVLLDSVIGDDSRTHFYLQKIMQQGMTILPPTINQPFLCYQVHDHQIRLPIITVRHIGPVFAENIWLNFQKKGRFSSIYDFCDRLSGRAFNQKSYFALVYSGTFDEFGLSRTVLADNFSVITNYASLKQKVHDQDDDVLPQPVLTTNKVVDENELLRQENYYLKIILRVKLIQQYRQKIAPQSLSIKSLLATLPSTTELVVMIIKMTTLQDKRNRNMAFLDVIDEQYYAWERLVVFASVFPKVINELAVGNIVHMVIVRSKNQQKTSYFLAKAQ